MVWLQDLNLPTPRANLPEQYGEPDYSIKEAHLTRFNAQGQRLQTLKSTQITHYPEKDLTLFENPLIHHYSLQGQVWQITAKRAEQFSNNDIYLEEKVVITPLNPDSDYLPEFLTERLWVDSESNLAHTQDPVSFISPTGKTTGEGFQLHLGTGLAEILQTVQGNYLPLQATQDSKL